MLERPPHLPVVHVGRLVVPLGVLLGVLLVLAAACSTPPERLAVVAPVAQTRGWVPLQSLGPDGALVGAEHRPTFEASLRRPLDADGPPVVAGSTLRQIYRVGPLASRRPMLVLRWYRDKVIRGDRLRLPAVRAVPVDRRIEVEFEIGAVADPTTIEIGAEARLVPAAQRSVALDPIEVGKGDVLLGGIGLDPIAQGLAVHPIEFRVVARSDTAKHVLLERVVDPAQPGAFAWSDFRVDLGELAGQTVHLELSSTLRVPEGSDPAEAVGFPVWSTPRVIGPAAAADPEPRNVILISLDTLRADYVGAYGQALATTPSLDRFAAEGALFESTYTTYPSTTAAHMSMLTGLYPPVHGVYAPGQRLPPRIPLLAEVLSRRGYSTAAVTENGMLGAGSGFARGFDTLREYKSPEHDTEGHVGEVVDNAVAWLREHHDERFFLFLHTYQVHGPYKPPAAYDVFPTPEVEGLAPAHAAARRGYAGDLLYADAEVGRLLDELAALGEDERTVVVVTSDHGEALGENGVLGHGWYVDDAVVHVPLVIRAPGVVPGGRRVAVSTSLVDVTPTILDLAGPAPPGAAPLAAQGRSLLGALANPAADGWRDREVYTEKLNNGAAPTVVVHRGRLKWKSGGANGNGRYDLASDPGELTARSDAEALAEAAAGVRRFEARNREMLAALGQPKIEKVEVDESTERKLRALGYTE